MASSPYIWGPTGSLFIGTPQGAAGTVPTNDGAGNLSWTSPGTPAPTTFNFSNNVSSFADITGFLVSSTTAFSSLLSIIRSTSAYSTTTYTYNTAFNTNFSTGFDNATTTAAVQPSDQKIVVGGQYTTFNGLTRNRLVRINTDGTEDTAFYTSMGSAFDSDVDSVAIQSNGQILVGGGFTTFNGAGTSASLVRLNSNGTLDSTFSTNLGTSFDSIVYAVAVQPSDQKILVAGAFANFNGNSRNCLVRLNTDGTEDTSFYTNLGAGFNDGSSTVYTLTVQANGQIVVGGKFSELNSATRNNLVRLNSDGTEDTSFYSNLGTAFNGLILSTMEQADTSLLIGGNYTSFNSNTRNYLVRLTSSGIEDATFYTNLGGALNNIVRSTIQLPDTSLVIGGAFTDLGATSYNAIIGLALSGVPNSFYSNITPAYSSSGVIYHMVLNSSNQILVAGDYSIAGFSVGNFSEIGNVNSFAAANSTLFMMLNGVYDSLTSTWTIQSVNGLGSSVGISLQMTSAGQLQYESSNLGGPVVLNQMKFLITEL